MLKLSRTSAVMASAAAGRPSTSMDITSHHLPFAAAPASQRTTPARTRCLRLDNAVARREHAGVSDWTSDTALARAALAREPRALDELTLRLEILPGCVRTQNLRYGRRLTREEEEDVVQNVVASLWRKLADFDGRTTLEGWAYGFVCVEVLRAYERRARRPEPTSLDEELHDTPAPEDAPADSGESERLNAALARLPEPSGEVVRLKHFEDLTFEQIAERQHESVNTVKTRYYRALERLKLALSLRQHRPS
jgi:RNA polymerase sigma-70 factor (ECF subfamily)